MVLQLYHLPLPLLPPVSNFSCLFTLCQPLYASCCTILLYFFKVLYCKIKNVYFFICLMYYFCEKYYRSITVQYYIADCIYWVSRLILLDLQRNWTYKETGLTNVLSEWNLFICRGHPELYTVTIPYFSHL